MNQNGILLEVQKGIDNTPGDVRGNYSDGYHTFNELYEHRIMNFIALCRLCAALSYHERSPTEKAWRSQAHSDGSVWEGWFILGVGTEPGKQITYHLPMEKWEDCRFAKILEKAPDWDGHTSNDVLQRLKDL